MGFRDVAFMSSLASFAPYFLKIVLEEKALGQPHVLQLWLGVSKGMLPVKCFCFSYFCVSLISKR